MKAGTGSGKTACREKVGKAGESWAANSWSANSLELKSVFQQSQTCLTATELHWWKTRNSCLGTRSIQLHFCCDSSVESSFHHHHMLIIILDHKRRKSKLWKSHQSLMRLPHVTRLNSKGKPGKVPIFPMRFKILNDHDSDCGFSVLVNT